MENNQNPAEVRARLKRRIILVFVGTCVLLVLTYGAVSLAERMLYGSPQDENYSSSYIFFDSDYEMNIYDDAEYMDLNRYITFSDGVISTALDEGEYAEQDEDVRFMIGYIQSIIAGDAETYNACFSEQYYTQNKPLDRFTMQKLYEIKLTRAETQTVENGEGEYTTHGYIVEYMIRHNNGTFRRDLGSDSIRAQYLVISDREGTWKIDNTITYSYS